MKPLPNFRCSPTRAAQHGPFRPPSPTMSLSAMSLSLSNRDSPPASPSSPMGTIAEAPNSSASSPLYAAHSPACSDTSSLAHDPDGLENLIPPVLRKAVSLSALVAGGKQRRKRSRTTPEQLEKLEEYFAADQSPTAARRREIARELGLDERQTQIWFQNRFVWSPLSC